MLSRNQMSKLPIKKNVDEKLDLIPENKNIIVGDALSQNAPDDIPKNLSAKYLDNASKNGVKFNSISKIQPRTEIKPRLTGPPIEKTLKPITKIEIGNNVGNINGGDSFESPRNSVKEMVNSKNNSQKINSNSNDNINVVKSTENPVSMTSLSIGSLSVKSDSSKFNSKIKDRMMARRNSTEKESIPPVPISHPSPPSSSSASPNKPLGSMIDSVRNLPNMNTDNKSRDNALYLAKNLRPKSINIISTRSSVRIDTNIPARSVLNRLPTPRTSTNSSPVIQTTVQNDDKNRYSRNISINSRDGKGYGRKIKIQPKLNKELFLLNRDGIIVSLKKRGLESDIIPENVGNLVTKFRDLVPEDYDHMAIHQFGFEKIYSISDTILQEYNPKPSKKSPYQYIHTEKALDHKDYKYDPKMYEKTESSVSIIIDQRNNHGISETKPIPSPELIRQSSVKQIAREKRFLSELFLPLLNEKLKPDVLDFIKEEVTMQLNLKICDLYEDEELSITDKETFEKALGAYLRSERLIKLLTESRDSLLSFVKANMPTNL